MIPRDGPAPQPHLSRSAVCKPSSSPMAHSLGFLLLSSAISPLCGQNPLPWPLVLQSWPPVESRGHRGFPQRWQEDAHASRGLPQARENVTSHLVICRGHRSTSLSWGIRRGPPPGSGASCQRTHCGQPQTLTPRCPRSADFPGTVSMSRPLVPTAGSKPRAQMGRAAGGHRANCKSTFRLALGLLLRFRAGETLRVGVMLRPIPNPMGTP